MNFVGPVRMTLGLVNASPSASDFLCTLWYFTIVNLHQRPPLYDGHFVLSLRTLLFKPLQQQWPPTHVPNYQNNLSTMVSIFQRLMKKSTKVMNWHVYDQSWQSYFDFASFILLQLTKIVCNTCSECCEPCLFCHINI